jgi:hypothetical protein
MQVTMCDNVIDISMPFGALVTKHHDLQPNSSVMAPLSVRRSLRDDV